MVRLRTAFFAILSAQASRRHASRLMPGEPDLRLQSGIAAVGKEPEIVLSQQLSSGGVPSTLGHLAPPTGSQGWVGAASAVFLGSMVVLVLFAVFGCCSVRGRRLSVAFREQFAAQVKGLNAPSPHREEWSLGNSVNMGPFGCEKTFLGKGLPMLEGELSTVTFDLNSKITRIEEGYLIVWSKQMNQYHLLWKDGMKAKAYAALNIAVATECPTTAIDVDLEEMESFGLPDDAELYDSLRHLSKRVQGPVSKFPKKSMKRLTHGKQSRYIVVKPSCDTDPSKQWRDAQVKFFLTEEDFRQHAEPIRSVRVSDIVSVSWLNEPPGSDPRIVVATNKQAGSFMSFLSFQVKETHLGRESRDATMQLQKDLIELRDMIQQIE